MNKLLKNCLTYVLSGVFSLILFSILLHIDPLESFCDIYLYKCFFYAGITVIFLVLVLLLLWKKPLLFLDIKLEEILSTALICLLALGFFASTVIMPMDRSYTIYSLADMADNSDRIYSLEEIENDFINVYIKAMKSTDRRISEQVGIGNLAEVDGGYQITEKGQQLIEMYRILDKIYPVDNKTSIYPNQ